ncbi:MAG: hypothetical protein SP1CHLAM54_14380 [Chlamydiia bacterium]|nr:hypothetical protein [Chlamydiia bacterium]MCH9616330.1 hypothetical protein [Chlamydiia bacterium]MCH9629684.1 hypothetical protein [Chlamydiia bacterium]
MKTIGLVYGPQLHHLDHIAPLCSIFGIPLVVTEPDIHALAEKYYPELVTFYFPTIEAAPRIVNTTDTVISSLPSPLFDQIFLISEEMAGKKLKQVWCPHGNSDKGHASPFMEGLEKNQTALVYGKKMLDFFEDKGVKPRKTHLIGNYRYHYAKKMAPFHKRVLDLPKGPLTLYAPTWDDSEKSCSLFNSIEEIQNAAQNLVVKIHPNTYLQKPFEVDDLIARYPHVHFLIKCPLIYPILERTEVYIGDMSSIGYDFLTFNRPMFFLNPAKRKLTDPGLTLHTCGMTFDGDLTVDQSFLESKRAELYNYTFADLPLEKVHEICRRL